MFEPSGGVVGGHLAQLDHLDLAFHRLQVVANLGCLPRVLGHAELVQGLLVQRNRPLGRCYGQFSFVLSLLGGRQYDQGGGHPVAGNDRDGLGLAQVGLGIGVGDEACHLPLLGDHRRQQGARAGVRHLYRDRGRLVRLGVCPRFAGPCLARSGREGRERADGCRWRSGGRRQQRGGPAGALGCGPGTRRMTRTRHPVPEPGESGYGQGRAGSSGHRRARSGSQGEAHQRDSRHRDHQAASGNEQGVENREPGNWACL